MIDSRSYSHFRSNILYIFLSLSILSLRWLPRLLPPLPGVTCRRGSRWWILRRRRPPTTPLIGAIPSIPRPTTSPMLKFRYFVSCVFAAFEIDAVKCHLSLNWNLNWRIYTFSLSVKLFEIVYFVVAASVKPANCGS